MGRPNHGRRAPGTAYLPPERAGALQLAAEIARVAASPVVEALLVGSATALAILDENRQIVALNARYLELLGASRPAELLGLRPGEAAGCAHARAGAGGCGTGPACASCGAAVALLVASRGRPGERDCALRIARTDGPDDRVLRVRVAPLRLDGRRFLAFALADVTADRRRAAVQHVFLHDLANLAAGIQAAASEVAELGGAAAELTDDLRVLSSRLVREVRLQRALADGAELPRAAPAPVRPADVLRGLATLAAHHPAGGGKRLDLGAPPDGVGLVTDPLLLEHVLANMLVNAFEATPRGGVVRVSVAMPDGAIAFRVWNAGDIPVPVRPRIFQRHFTTKPGEGRGHGTFAMRLFGEECLGGEVSFATGESEGTTFELRLPRAPPGA